MPGLLVSSGNPDGKSMTTTPPLGPRQLDGWIAICNYVNRQKSAASTKVVLKGIMAARGGGARAGARRRRHPGLKITAATCKTCARRSALVAASVTRSGRAGRAMNHPGRAVIKNEVIVGRHRTT